MEKYSKLDVHEVRNMVYLDHCPMPRAYHSDWQGRCLLSKSICAGWKTKINTSYKLILN